MKKAVEPEPARIGAMAARSNRTATNRAVGALRKAGRIDATDAGLVRLAESSAAALDDALEADEKSYAVAALMRVHLAVLQALDACPVIEAAEDPFAAFMAEAMTPGPGSTDGELARFD